MNEQTHFFIKIYLFHFILERMMLVAGEVSWRRGTDCYILTPSSSDHSSTSIAFWLGCSNVVPWGSKPSIWSWFSLRLHPISNWNWNWLTQAVCGTLIYNCPTSTCFLWAYVSATITEFNHVHRSRWYSDIFTRMHLFRCSSTYLHRCISWLTTWSSVNILHAAQIFYRNKCNSRDMFA